VAAMRWLPLDVLAVASRSLRSSLRALFWLLGCGAVFGLPTLASAATASAAENTRSNAQASADAADASAIAAYSDQELTSLASRWGLLSEPQRDALLAETRGRMLRQMAHNRPGDRMLSARELRSLGVAATDQSGGQILADLPGLVAYMRALAQRRANGAEASLAERQQAQQGGGKIRIERRYGRKVVRSNGRVVQQVETRVYQVTRGDPTRAYGRMGFERRHESQTQERGVGHQVPLTDVIRVNAPTP